MIDVESYYTASRGMFAPNADIYTVGFMSHKLKPLMSSSVFSPPALLLQMDAGGSIGHQISDVQSWGEDVGQMDRTITTRTFYRKLHCICPVCDDPEMKIRMLWGQFRAHGVKKPVVRHMYIRRGGIFMLWRYKYSPTRFLAGLERLKEWSMDGDFERAFTFDLIAASDVSLESEDFFDSIRFAHDLNFLYNRVRRALLTAHDEPTPIVRREWIEVPRVVVRAIPITRWRQPQLPA